MNATTISSLVVAIISLAGAATAYFKSRTTQSNLEAHQATPHRPVAATPAPLVKDYEPGHNA